MDVNKSGVENKMYELEYLYAMQLMTMGPPLNSLRLSPLKNFWIFLSTKVGLEGLILEKDPIVINVLSKA